MTHLDRPGKPCSVRGCRRLAAVRGRCLVCHRDSQRARPSARSRGFSTKWDKLAKDWLERRPWCGMQADGSFSGENSRCARRGLKVPATVVNHKLSPRQGGAWFTESNLESLCKGCNLAHAHKTGLMDAKQRGPNTDATNTDNDWNIG